MLKKNEEIVVYFDENERVKAISDTANVTRKEGFIFL